MSNIENKIQGCNEFHSFSRGDVSKAKGLDSIRLILLFIFMLILPTTANAQCAMCRAALESSGDNGLAEGINNGIVFLMAIPYILVAVIGYIIYRMIKKSKNGTA